MMLLTLGINLLAFPIFAAIMVGISEIIIDGGWNYSLGYAVTSYVLTYLLFYIFSLSI